MSDKKNAENQFRDIVELDDQTLTLAEIELIARDDLVCQTYEKKYKDRLYSLALLSLTHESFSEDEATKLWNTILSHMRHLDRVLGRSVGLPVASLDYLANIKGALSEPKIIEEDKSSFVAGVATKDELTGLYMREVFEVVLKKELEHSKRKSAALCLLMIDIDDFKQVNDTYGHPAGDEVLRGIGSTLNDTIREMDLAARYGGEELAVIMPGANLSQGYQVAERVRKRIQGMSFRAAKVTVSVGVSQSQRRGDSPERLISSADKALYAAKAKGKNQVVKSASVT